MESILLIICLAMVFVMGIICYMLLSRIRRLNEEAKQEFQLMTAESIARSSDALRTANSEQLNSILTPLKMRIEDFNRQMQESHIDAASSRRSLSDQIERLSKLNISIASEARNLATALRGSNNTQGKWGETVLETILEKAGLQKGVNFETQATRDRNGETLRDDSGALRRPDVLIYLPENRTIIVDAKTSLSAYLDYCELPEGPEAEEAARRHVASVRKHIDELASKNYTRLVPEALDQVLMFIPNDAALIFALDRDRTLAEYAFARKVTLVSPSQIMGIVMMVQQMWRRDRQDRNTAEIARIGGLLYDSVAGFLTDMQNIEKSLNAAHNAYNAAYMKLSASQRSILSRAGKLRELGAKTTKNISAD